MPRQAIIAFTLCVNGFFAVHLTSAEIDAKVKDVLKRQQATMSLIREIALTTD